MGRFVRQFVFGLFAGLLLSALRAPGGLDLVHLHVPSAHTTALFRAVALFAVAIPLDSARRAWRGGVSFPLLSLGVALGYATHGLFLAAKWEPETRGGFAVLALLGVFSLLIAAGGRTRGTVVDETEGTAEQRPEGADSPGLRERLGLVLVGAGLAFAFEHLARYVRLFGVGLPEDDTVFGSVLCVGIFVGAISFGPFVWRSRWQTAATAGLGALAAATTLVGLRFADHLEYEAGLDPLWNYVGRFGLNLTMVGHWKVSGLLGAAFFVVPAFALGTALSAAKNARRLSALVSGGGVGLLLLPWVIDALAEPFYEPELWSAPWAWLPWALATVLAVSGAALALAGNGPRGPRRGGWVALVVALGTVLFGPRLAIWPFSPWYIVPIEPLMAMPIAEGLITVEGERGGLQVVTIDRKLLTPTAKKADVDSRRIEWSWAMLSEEVRAGEPRVLFLGQMTPMRAQTLAGLGAMRLERSVPWYRASEAIEGVLFEGEAPPPGTLIEPAEAGARIRAGDYDLVLVTPSQGPLLRPSSAYLLPWGGAPAPATAGLSVPDGTLAVAWIDAGSPLENKRLPGPGLLAAKHFDDLSFGLLLGAQAQPRTSERPPVFPSGEPHVRESGWALLNRSADARARTYRAALLMRLAEAAVGTDAEALARGLLVHYAAQRTSSSFDSYATQIELEEDSLRAYLEAALEGPMDPLTRSFFDDLALLLSEKRRVDMSLVYLEPVLETHGPWEALERSVAYAYSEFNMFDEALELLDRVLERDPYQIDLLMECGRLAAEKADFEAALDYLQRALDLQPIRIDIQVQIAITRYLRGDPDALAALERFMEEHPEEAPVIHPYLREEDRSQRESEIPSD